MAYVNTYANTTQTMRKQYANDAQRTRIRNAKAAHMFVLRGVCVELVFLKCFVCAVFATLFMSGPKKGLIFTK